MPSAGLQVCVKGINHWIYTFAVQAMNVIGSRKSMHIPRALLHHMSVFFVLFGYWQYPVIFVYEPTLPIPLWLGSNDEIALACIIRIWVSNFDMAAWKRSCPV